MRFPAAGHLGWRTWTWDFRWWRPYKLHPWNKTPIMCILVVPLPSRHLILILRWFSPLTPLLVLILTVTAECRAINELFFSSWNCQSTRSFFPGHSITLGRLIGIKPGDRALHLPNSNLNKEHDQNSMVRVSSHASSRSRVEVSQGICMPLLLNVLVKISPSRGNSRW